MFGCCAPLRLSSLSALSLVLPLRWFSRVHSTKTRNQLYHTRTASTWEKNTGRFFRKLFCCYVEPQDADTSSATVMSEQADMISDINKVNSGYSNSAYSKGVYSEGVSAITTVTGEIIMPQPAPERYTGPKRITNDFGMLSTITMPLPRIVVTPDLPTQARSSVNDMTRFSLPLEAYMVPLSPPPRCRRRWLESTSSSQATTDVSGEGSSS
ncbi:hypothetical protein DFS33DRAFT_1336559 [Desarmillaria ectypa]|nr:hypothetical protein DFS33DRAFT_1336559 [Desarmillaria ectypa]